MNASLTLLFAPTGTTRLHHADEFPVLGNGHTAKFQLLELTEKRKE